MGMFLPNYVTWKPNKSERAIWLYCVAPCNEVEALPVATQSHMSVKGYSWKHVFIPSEWHRNILDSVAYRFLALLVIWKQYWKQIEITHIDASLRKMNVQKHTIPELVELRPAQAVRETEIGSKNQGPIKNISTSLCAWTDNLDMRSWAIVILVERNTYREKNAILRRKARLHLNHMVSVKGRLASCMGISCISLAVLYRKVL